MLHAMHLLHYEMAAYKISKLRPAENLHHSSVRSVSEQNK